MQDAPVGSQDAPTVGYGLREAATLLGVGVNTLRRRIAAGQVRADRVERAQGFVWRVYLDGRHPPNDPPNDPPGDAPIRDAPGSVPHPPTAMMQAEAMAAYTRSLLEPLVTHVGALETTIRELERENGRVTAELTSAQDQMSKLLAERDELKASLWKTENSAPAPEAVQAQETSPGPSTASWWCRWRAWVAIATALAVLGSSCQASAPTPVLTPTSTTASTKHAGLCSYARSAMDGHAAAGGAPTDYWLSTNALVDVVAKTC
jgi:hypothetical protein